MPPPPYGPHRLWRNGSKWNRAMPSILPLSPSRLNPTAAMTPVRTYAPVGTVTPAPKWRALTLAIIPSSRTSGAILLARVPGGATAEGAGGGTGAGTGTGGGRGAGAGTGDGAGGSWAAPIAPTRRDPAAHRTRVALRARDFMARPAGRVTGRVQAPACSPQSRLPKALR